MMLASPNDKVMVVIEIGRWIASGEFLGAAEKSSHLALE